MATIPKRQRKLTIGGRKLIYLVLYHLPPPPKTKNNTSSNRKAPEYDVDTTPRFLHLSSFREDPNSEYEKRISDALLDIERKALRERNWDTSAEDRIWQVALGKYIERESDSLEFEQENRGWKYTLVDDKKASKLITEIFSSVPDLKKLYDYYPYHVIRSDLIRYLILWYYGSFYADMDVYPARAIKECPALEPLWEDGPKSQNVSLVVGTEIDEPHASPRLMREWRWIRRYQLIQYTIYAPRRFSPILRESNFLRGPCYKAITILEVTGPGVFTDAVLDVLSQTLPPTHSLVESSMNADADIEDLVSPSTGVTQRRVKWAPFNRIKEPVCVDASEAMDGKSMGGVCVLPVNVWGNGQRHSCAEGFSSKHACINHRFGWNISLGNSFSCSMVERRAIAKEILLGSLQETSTMPKGRFRIRVTITLQVSFSKYLAHETRLRVGSKGTALIRLFFGEVRDSGGMDGDMVTLRTSTPKRTILPKL